MPVIRINAEGDIPVLHGGHRSLAPTLTHALKQNGPVVVMVHGYSFLPYDRIHCPHRHIFSGADHLANPKALSWPKNLGFGTGLPDEGLAIAFGWHARGTLWAPEKRPKARHGPWRGSLRWCATKPRKNQSISWHIRLGRISR
ncbi:hypothetical protein [Shimia thalassica]|uniref:hypothetical protein n=1 Tax=Shimia thalassica TaxID=1715693 RepID=UPI0026E3CABB|nr:hypothetical protein [Shimia thalassica]MDO6796822.1 hypothetical protein [Shimia thalassica]